MANVKGNNAGLDPVMETVRKDRWGGDVLMDDGNYCADLPSPEALNEWVNEVCPNKIHNIETLPGGGIRVWYFYFRIEVDPTTPPPKVEERSASDKATASFLELDAIWTPMWITLWLIVLVAVLYHIFRSAP